MKIMCEFCKECYTYHKCKCGVDICDNCYEKNEVCDNCKAGFWDGVPK